MARTNKTNYAILGMTASFKELSGYDIKKLLNVSSGWYWSESEAQIYPMLKKLEKDGAVVSRVANNGAREKRLYKITPLGSKLLTDWISMPVVYQPRRESLLLKLRFGFLNDPEVILEHIMEFKRSVKSKASKIPYVKKQLSTLHSEKDQIEVDYVNLTYGYEEEILAAQAAWCDKAIAIISKYIEMPEAIEA